MLHKCQVFEDELKHQEMGRVLRQERYLSRLMPFIFILMKGTDNIWSLLLSCSKALL